MRSIINPLIDVALTRIWNDNMGLIFLNGDTYLDLDKVKFYGYHLKVTRASIDAIIRGIENEDKFPAVPVYKTGIKTYELVIHKMRQDLRFNDGGHTRSVAHKLTHKPLLVEILNKDSKVPFFRYNHLNLMPLTWRKHISDIQIVDDGGIDYKNRKERDGRYR
ncbi:hypothetical protein J4407_03065 [Candidatus Pacearchaeota archaeon]|nr:hypothetical protein [Candidatus Pacearchaeota archaeon]